MIALVDHTTGAARPADGELERVAAALAKQIWRDFAGRWRCPRPQVIVSPDPGAGIPVHLFNDPDEAGVLGYHDVDDHGLPYAHVFVAPHLEAGGAWSTGTYAVSATLSHEVLETLGDRTANLFAPTLDGAAMWAFEACDACEAFSYEIDGVAVSDFVLPSFFTRGGQPPFDHLGQLPEQFVLGAGGYTIKASVGNIGQTMALVDQHGDNWTATVKPAPAVLLPHEVEFDDAVPEWRRAMKLTPGSRTTWRQIL